MTVNSTSGRYIDIAVTILHETERAYLADDGDVEEWIPKSQVRNLTNQQDGTTIIEIPEWLAEEKGMI